MNNTVAYLRTTAAIRERCSQIFDLAVADKLEHFAVSLERLPACVGYVAKVIREEYPKLDIPYHSRWRHFDVGGIHRAENLFAAARMTPLDEVRARFDLAVTSVLLDAGAGATWSYREPSSGKAYSRSEGLAVASFDLFAAGQFSSDQRQPLQADAEGLQRITTAQLERGFQVSAENPLVGVAGRVSLLQRLGLALRAHPEIFGAKNPRIGNMADYLIAQAGEKKQIAAPQVLAAVLTGLGSIWPGRTEIDGVNLGDVWPHPAVSLVPFHKLSQWLTYSLLEPLETLGFTITGLEQLTGLPEYRNGGLFLDLEVLTLKNPALAHEKLKPSHPAIVEWRALTVVLLDKTAALVQKNLGLTPAEFPLAKVLQGGTWTAGRRIAAEKRPGGTPPLQVDSDGTVF